MFYFNESYESDERFDGGKLLEFQNNFSDMVNSYFVLQLPTLPIHGTFRVSGEDSRPELISYKIYKDVQYWWILMIYNQLIEVDEIVTGMILNYPSMNDLETLYFQLKPLQRAKDLTA